MTELVGHPAADLVLVNDDDLTYAKLRLDERSLATLRTRIGAIPDPLARALCWSAAWDMTRDAELPAREWVQLVLAGVDAETEISVVQSLLARVQTALSSFADPAWAPRAGPSWPTTRWPRSRPPRPAATSSCSGHAPWPAPPAPTSTPPSCAGCSTGHGRSRASRWTPTRGGRSCPGWSPSARAGDAEIDAEAERDATATGVRRAATARALRPTKESKAETWQRGLPRRGRAQLRARGDAARLLAPGPA